mmetsp:Transcript_21210/g.55170  ORF Transcript_21210/g.55170 Transcript_21210/m.55170 type:complete len:99 (-) Transcript_21210:24-320(-)
MGVRWRGVEGRGKRKEDTVGGMYGRYFPTPSPSSLFFALFSSSLPYLRLSSPSSSLHLFVLLFFCLPYFSLFFFCLSSFLLRVSSLYFAAAVCVMCDV